MKRLLRWLLLALILAGIAWLGWAVYAQLQETARSPEKKPKSGKPVPVVTAPITTGPIALRRAFSGTLEAHAGFVAAPKVGGVVQRLMVHLGDEVRKGQIVAKLDDAEYVQAVAQAEADLLVARANQAEADSLLEIAERELQREISANQKGVSSASQRDAAKADQLARAAHVKVTRAQISRARAALETARIQLGYTEVRADWHGDDARRVVAERFVDEGETLSANDPLLKIIQLDPITAVLFATEKDYAGLRVGQAVSLSTDAYPGKIFQGHIERVAPEFSTSTRQARIEIRVGNPEQALKPGMFVRAEVVLREVADATIIPSRAVTKRKGKTGVFLVSEDGAAVRWQVIEAGILEDSRQQIIAEGLSGEVVVLGQQLLKDGSQVKRSEP